MVWVKLDIWKHFRINYARRVRINYYRPSENVDGIRKEKKCLAGVDVGVPGVAVMVHNAGDMLDFTIKLIIDFACC